MKFVAFNNSILMFIKETDGNQFTGRINNKDLRHI